MLRKLYLLFAVLFVLTCVNAQTPTVEEIRGDANTYLYGEGKGFTLKEADNNALAEIISQISISVESNSELNTQESTENGVMNLDEKFKSVINTSSNATLVNIGRISIANEPDAHVMRYIRKEDITRVFDGRKHKVEDMIENARTSLSERKINDAIRNFYWAHVLLQTLLFPNDVFIYDNNGMKQMANVWIPKQIDEILYNIKFVMKEVDDDNTLFMNVFYKDEPVRSIDYCCFDGSSWGSIYNGVDGKGVVELRQGADVEKIQLRVEYMFEEESVRDPEVNKLLAVSQKMPYKKAYKNIVSEPKVEEEETKSPEQSSFFATQQEEATSNNGERYENPELAQVEDVEEYQQIVQEIIRSIASKNLDTDVRSYFTEAGYKDYLNLIKFGAAKVIDASNPLYYALGGEVYCRNILMNFSFKTNNRHFMENVVLKFDEEKHISHVTFGLEREASDDVLSREQWPEAARIILVHFLENYKTAYALKQVDYIESIFAEDALIITGSLVRTATVAELGDNKKEYVRYTQQSKSEYISKLRNIFKSNEYVNLQFADNQIVKAGKGGEIYGIQIRQNYFSTHYGDTGYLFLMVDLNDIEKPIVHVRTWQPEKDLDFGLYGLPNF